MATNLCFLLAVSSVCWGLIAGGTRPVLSPRNGGPPFSREPSVLPASWTVRWQSALLIHQAHLQFHQKDASLSNPELADLFLREDRWYVIYIFGFLTAHASIRVLMRRGAQRGMKSSVGKSADAAR